MDNSKKTPVHSTLPGAIRKRVDDALQLTGKALPCSVVSVDGAIVTVKFELTTTFTLPNVTVPIVGAEYIRYPIQAGCKGVVFAADARLGGVSGLGGGTADLSQPSNLTALVFLPISNTAWSTVDPNAVTIYGPNGVVLRDSNSDTTFVLTPNGLVVTGQNSVKLVVGSTTLELTSSGLTIHGDITVTGKINTTGDVVAGSISLMHHLTTAVTSGSSLSGPPQ